MYIHTHTYTIRSEVITNNSLDLVSKLLTKPIIISVQVRNADFRDKAVPWVGDILEIHQVGSNKGKTNPYGERNCGNLFSLPLNCPRQKILKRSISSLGPRRPWSVESLGLNGGCSWQKVSPVSFTIHFIRGILKWTEGACRSTFGTHRIFWTTI